MDLIGRHLDEIAQPHLGVVADVATSEGAQSFVDQVMARFHRIDYLICNASPTMRPSRFTEQTEAELLGFIESTIRTYSGVMRAALPILDSAATVVAISSIITKAPIKPYSHYIAAKAAVEGLVLGLAAEYGHLRFILARPPRMLTDQTNLAHEMDESACPIKVAAALVSHILKARDALDQEKRTLEIDLLPS
jgi:NAD(P)-dependent dehydrogenase (short-subunit alcohol dehydrogenase family)